MWFGGAESRMEAVELGQTRGLLLNAERGLLCCTGGPVDLLFHKYACVCVSPNVLIYCHPLPFPLW